jgi:antirestriction protein ArdC
MPTFEQFKTPVDYYATRGHETTHATGHVNRCNREFGKRFGDSAYAFEELVAELGAAYLCAHLELANEPRADHAAYVNNWLTVLKGDKKAIFTAASQAQKAVDWIINTAGDAAESAENDVELEMAA